MEIFEIPPGFCSTCGSILPTLGTVGNVICYICKKQCEPSAFGNQEVQFTIPFTTYDPEKILSKLKNEAEEVADGPVVDRKCSKCGYDKMSYATLQLRSADEGQTVFFTCLKCKYKESENS